MDILEVKNLTKKFDEVTAVDNISFSLKKGEILGLLGPNGAGKTTTIQMLLSVLEPTSGSIRYFGQELKTHREEILEQVNFSSTYINMPWTLTVKENLKVISHLYQIADRRKRLDELVQIFDLGGLMSQTVDTLSAGQMTRLNLAKAFLNRPKILLLDEPTASLDPDVAKTVREYIVKQRQDQGISILLTSHNMAEVEEVCDRAVFINQGKIISDDTPQNLARTIQVSHIELLVTSGVERLKDFCQRNSWMLDLAGKYARVALPERHIPEFLKNLPGLGVNYDEISIEKPSLEDYFLTTVTNAKQDEIASR